MIDGFSITGYRSFGPDEVKISDLSQINIFIGKYNCGKSNILRFAKRIAAGSSQQARARAQTRISIIAVATNEGRSSSAFRAPQTVFLPDFIRAKPYWALILSEWFEYS